MDNKRTLKADKNFIPQTVDDGDEYYPNGIFVFNITKLLEHLKNYPEKYKPEPLQVTDNYIQFSVIDEEFLPKADTTNPIILAEISPGNYNIIDGHHRMTKAYRTGQKEIMAYKLDPDTHTRFLTSTRSYLQYIEYWNSK